MLTYKPLLLALLMAGASYYAQAQEANGPWCTTHDLDHLVDFHQNDPVELQRLADADEELEAFTRAFAMQRSGQRDSPYIIPVVFHIIHENGPENISDEQVYDAVRILNEDFNKQNPDWENVNEAFIDLVADVGIEFRLPKRDPQGNCTNGITRTESSLTNAGNQAMKNLIQWPRNRYLNVWISASAGGGSTVGYTQTPAMVSFNPTADGIVLRHNYLGSIGTSVPNRSRVLTHEVGHWINLRHTWGPTNNPGLDSNCDSDDNVDDTPLTRGWTSCNPNGESCGSLDNVHNYMEYSFCFRMFTEGQKTRMLAALNSGVSQRAQLWQNSNLAFTGVLEDGEICEARFSSTGRVICVGETVEFSDLSYHDVESWNWTFPGGEPAVAQDPDVTVTYNEPGIYPVGLTVSNSQGTEQVVEEEFIIVMPAEGREVPFGEDFEQMAELPNTEWFVHNEVGGGSWQLAGNAGYSGTKSVWFNNYQASPGDITELLSTTMDMSGVDNITISLRYAFARRTAGNDDRMRLYVSNDCGASWSMRKQWRGQTDLTTVPDRGTPFYPLSQDEWAFWEVDNINTNFHVSNFRFKLQFEAAGGNNIFVDDINVNGFPLSVFEQADGGNNLTVVPNPTQGMADAVFRLERGSEHTQLSMLDVLGRELAVVVAGQLPAGPHRFQLPVQGLQSGVYFLRLQQGSDVQVSRFIVN